MYHYGVATLTGTIFGSRATAVGDAAVTSGELPPYKGVPVKYAPVLNKTFSSYDSVN